MAILIIFLYGSDGYRLKENVDTVVGAYHKKHKSGMSFYCFGFALDQRYDDLANAVKSTSFFSEIKLILIKNIFPAEGGSASGGHSYTSKLAALITDFNLTKTKDIVLLVAESGAQKDLEKTDKNLFSLLSSPGNLVRNFDHLKGTQLVDWVRSKFRERNCPITPTIPNALIGAVGNESWSLINEIDKLSGYKKGGTVTEKDVELLVRRREDRNIFDLMDAVGAQNRTAAFETLFRLIKSGYDGYYLLNMLTYHFENLLTVSDLMAREKTSSAAAIAKKCGLHPFVVRKAVSQARKFPEKDLLEKFNWLSNLDVSSKSGLTNLEDSLYNFVLA